jgi:catechol 2,3-dioxygenase-like lactoylglutathione lyase family enzyme
VRPRLLDYTVLIVEDLDAALAFYVDRLGLTVSHRTGEYAQLVTGTTRLAFYTRRAMEKALDRPLSPPAEDAPAFELGFKVPDVDEAFAELVEAGAPVAAEPRDRPWGQRTGYVRDPDGNLIELVQDLG